MTDSVMGVSKIELRGVMPMVEHRREIDMHFVIYPAIGFELVMAFRRVTAAIEIAESVFTGEPFFTLIPVVPIRTAWPRPWLSYPKEAFPHIITRTI